MNQQRKLVMGTPTCEQFAKFKQFQLRKYPWLDAMGFDIGITNDDSNIFERILQENEPGSSSGMLAAIFYLQEEYPSRPEAGEEILICFEKGQTTTVVRTYFNWCLSKVEKHPNVIALLKEDDLSKGQKIAIRCH